MHHPTDRIVHTRCVALAGIINSLIGPSGGIDPTTHRTMSFTTELHPADRIVHTRCVKLAGMRNSLMGPSGGIDPTTNGTMSGHYATVLHTVCAVVNITLEPICQ